MACFWRREGSIKQSDQPSSSQQLWQHQHIHAHAARAHSIQLVTCIASPDLIHLIMGTSIQWQSDMWACVWQSDMWACLMYLPECVDWKNGQSSSPASRKLRALRIRAFSMFRISPSGPAADWEGRRRNSFFNIDTGTVR